VTLLTWVETKAVPAVEKWWRPVAIVAGFLLAVVLGKIMIRGVGSLFGARPAGPPPADGIVAAGEKQKQQISQEIKADSAQGVADAFNSAVKKVQP
jgi:hypothetical protein